MSLLSGARPHQSQDRFVNLIELFPGVRIERGATDRSRASNLFLSSALDASTLRSLTFHPSAERDRFREICVARALNISTDP
jgi:hypothetical protein